MMTTPENTSSGISATKIRLIFIIILLLTGLGLYLFAKSQSAADKKGNVLGENVPKTYTTFSIEGLKKDATNILNKTVENTRQAVSNVGKQAGIVVNDVTSQSVEKVKETVLDTAYSNAVKQIEKLPTEEQKKIKEYICK